MKTYEIVYNGGLVIMANIDISKISNAVKGKTIEEIIQYSDCKGQTFRISCTDGTDIEINRNEDGEFFMVVYLEGKPNQNIWSKRDWR